MTMTGIAPTCCYIRVIRTSTADIQKSSLIYPFTIQAPLKISKAGLGPKMVFSPELSRMLDICERMARPSCLVNENTVNTQNVLVPAL